jgi:threonine dehydrogenase-like Zn-dependent dehydrogenase
MHDHGRIVAEVSDITVGQNCPRVIEAVGRQWPLDLATELVGFGGRLIVAGYHQDGPRQVAMQTWNWKGIDVINAHERDRGVQRRGIEEGLAAVAAGSLDLAPLITHRFPLERLGDALDATRDKPGNFVKAVVTLA